MTLTTIKKAGLDELALDHIFTVGASGTDHYTFQGEGLNGTVNDPTLYLTRGKTYRFEKGSAHPLRIQSTSGSSGTAYNTGVTNNGGTGTVIMEVQHDAPDTLYYQCTSHANMNGIIFVTGALSGGSVTEAKLANNAVTTNKIANDAVTAAKLADTSVSAGSYGSSTSIPSITVDAQGRITAASGNTVNTDLVGDSSPQLGGDLDCNGNEILVDDSNAIKIGNGADLRLFHDGTDSHIKNFTGTTFLFGDSIFIGSTTAGEPYFKGFADGAAELYHNSQKRLETTTDGITLSGNIVLGDTPDTNTGTAGNRVRIGASNDLQLFHGPNNSYIRNDTGSFNIEQYANSTLDIFSNHDVRLRVNGGELAVDCSMNGGVDLYYDASAHTTPKLQTKSHGVDVNGKQIIEIGSVDAIGLDIHSNSNVRPTITFDTNRSAAHNTIGSISGKWNGTEVSRIATEAGRDTTNKDDGILVFSTCKSGGSLRPASWISSNGIFYVTADAMSNNHWTTFHQSPRGISDITQYNEQGYGLARCVRNVTSGSSAQSTSLIRVMRYYWGHGFYKITLKQHYYSSVNEADWYLEGYGRYDGSYNQNYSLSHHNRHGNINSGVLSLSTSTSSPAHTDTEYVDIIATPASYEQFIVEIEIATAPQRADSVTSTFHDVNCYALH